MGEIGKKKGTRTHPESKRNHVNLPTSPSEGVRIKVALARVDIRVQRGYRVIALASGSILPVPAQEQKKPRSEVLVKTAEREALVTLERLVNVPDAQDLQAWASSIIMIGRVAWVLVRFKRVLYLLTLYSCSTQHGVSGHPSSCVCSRTDQYNQLIFSENEKGSSLRWLR